MSIVVKDKTKLLITEVLAVAAVLSAVVLAFLAIRFGRQVTAPDDSRDAASARPQFHVRDSETNARTSLQRPQIASRESFSASVTTSPSPSAPPPPPPEATAPPLLTFGSRWNDPGQPTELVRFSDWIGRYLEADPSDDRKTLEAEGIALATTRYAAMRDAIRTQSELALQWSIPLGIQQQLPSSITALLEKSVSDQGTLAVFAALPAPGQEDRVRPVWRRATLHGVGYDAFVYGRRLGEPTRHSISLQGIALGGWIALSENPVRVLDGAEAAILADASSDPTCAVSGQAFALRQTSTAADVGGRRVRLCGVAHAHDLNARLIQAESSTSGGAAGGDANGNQGGTPPASSYTEGTKRLLIIRVDFADLPGDPLPATEANELFRELHDFYRDSSYHRAGIALGGSGSDVTPTLRLTNSAASYGANDDYIGLQDAARAAASAAGYNLANYDFDLACFGSIPGWSWAGLGWVGAPGVWLRSHFSVGVAAHELGHNLGLNHANFWETQGRSVIGNGASVEYGDVYDTMGSGDAGPAQFNARNKNYLNWMPEAAVQTVTTSGTYRIEAHDNPSANGLRALKITRNSHTNFWVEFRQQYTANPWMMNGATLRWAGHGNQHSDLLDTTPGSAAGKNDAALIVGRTFSDLPSGIHITTLRKAGTSPESLEIAVRLGSFPDNHPPSVTVHASASSSAPGAPITFTATASDPDGDELAYHWDFGDGTFGTNGAIVTKSWTLTSEFRVQCIVSDLKGGTARASSVVAIGSPPTYRINGRVTAGGTPLAGVRVSTASSRMTYTDSDGTYALVGLPASGYTVSASLEPYSFVAQGFVNPINVGPSASQINFTATGFNNPPVIATQPRPASAPAGEATNFTVTVSGTGPFGYRWRHQGTNLAGGTSATLTLTNLQPSQAGSYSVVVANAAGAVTSSPATLTVTAPISGLLALNINGSGSVRGATNGQRLVMGRSYQLTATPSVGNLFSNWTGSLPQSSPVLTFVMATNLQVTANFVPNPFVATRGVFNGLFHETHQVQSDRAGFFTLTLSSKGAYTASLLTRGWKLKAKGTLSLAGIATNRITTPDGQTYAVSWAVAQDGTDVIEGTITDGQWTAALAGDRLVYHPRTNAASQAGRYTSLVPGNPDPVDGPGGDSLGLVTVDTRGTVRLSGYLADQTRLAIRTSLSRSGQWPVYASLYGGRGALIGWVGFRDETRTDLDGVLSWTRPAMPGTTLYSTGFAGESTLIGSRYTPPLAGHSLIDWADPIIRFVGGNLSQSVTNRLTVTGPTVQGPDPRSLKLKVAASSGLFSGVVSRPETGSPQAFRGVVVQKAGIAGGYFLGTNVSGQVRLE